jgi:hypothetical protein
VGAITCGLGETFGRPLNHMSWPAASLAPAIGEPGFGMPKAGTSSPLGTKMVSPKPSVLSLILSPAASLTRLG